MQRECDFGVFGRVRTGHRDVNVVKAFLFHALAGNVLVVHGLAAQVALGDGVHVVARRRTVEHIRLDHGVKRDAAKRNAVIAQHVGVVLEMVADLGSIRILEQRAQCLQHGVAIKLLGRAFVAMCQGHVGAVAGLDRERHAHDFGVHVVEACGLRVEGEHGCLREPLKPRVKVCLVEHDLVDGLVGRTLSRACRVAVVIWQLTKQRTEVELAVDLAKCRNIGLAARQLVQRDRQIDVAADCGQITRQFELVDVVAQALAHFALDLVGACDEAVDAVVGAEPFGGRLGADLGHARDVVRGVAHQAQVVHDLVRPYAKLLRDHRVVKRLAAHGVHQGHVLADKLRHVLVAGGDEHRAARVGGLARQRADDIVGLHALDHHARQTEQVDQFVNRADLFAQFRRHRRPIGFVLGVLLVAKRLARRVKHHRHVRRCGVGEQLVEHVDDT